MSEMVLIFGIGVIAAILTYVSFKLQDEHFILQLLCIFFAFVLLGFIPAVTANATEQCGLYEVNETIVGGDTTLVYEELCFTKESKIPSSFMFTYYGFLILFFIYVSVMVVKKGIENAAQQIGKV